MADYGKEEENHRMTPGFQLMQLSRWKGEQDKGLVCFRSLESEMSVGPPDGAVPLSGI